MSNPLIADSSVTTDTTAATVAAVETPKTKPQFADQISDELFQELCVAHACNMRLFECKNQGKPWLPRNANLNRPHFAYAAQNGRKLGMTTWGQVAREYPCLKMTGRIAIFAAGMADTPIGHRNAVTRLVKWVENGGKHPPEPVKPEATVEATVEQPEVALVDGDGV